MADTTARMPNEILLACMDYLSLLDIVHLMALSKRWQQLAINHEMYWKYLTIALSSDSATEWFLLRLSRSRLRLITVDARLLDADSGNLYAILQGISAHLSYIQSLTCWVTYGEGHTSWLFNALSYPAYNLEELVLRVAVDMGDLNIPLLPRSLLMRTAPRLDKLALQNISVQYMPAGIFPSVRKLEFGYQTKYELCDVQALLQALASVRELTLTGYPRIKNEEASAMDTSAFGALDLLSLNLGCPMPQNMRELLPLHALPRVACSRANDDDVSALLSGVTGPLEMHVQPEEDAGDAFFVHLVAAESQRTRSFAERRAYYESEPGGAPESDAEGALPPAPCGVFLRADVAAALVVLSLPLALWPALLPFVLPLPALVELRIVLSRDSNDVALLQSVVVRSAEPLLSVATEVPAGALAAFVARALSGESLPVDVVLEGIHVTPSDPPQVLPANLVLSTQTREPSTRIYVVDQTGLLV